MFHAPATEAAAHAGECCLTHPSSAALLYLHPNNRVSDAEEGGREGARVILLTRVERGTERERERERDGERERARARTRGGVRGIRTRDQSERHQAAGCRRAAAER